jgi:hypothetical protein
MTKTTNAALFALLAFALTTMTACWDSDLEEDALCTDAVGDICDPSFDLEDCTCAPFEETEVAESAASEESYSFVLIEDMTDPVGGESPGADIDAISVTLPDEEVEHFATTIEDFNIGFVNNNYTNINRLLGKNDSGCEKQNFVALGGAQADGYVIVGFNSGDENVTFGSGAQVTVYELGKSTCSNRPNWDDDPYKVSISAGNARGSFIEIGSGGPGSNIITIP